jgi:hypothetical protein
VVLHGSLTVDDYVPGRSDVDLLGVVDDPLSDAQVAALTEAVARQRPRAPGRVDLRVVTRQVAASPTPAPPLEAYLEITPGSGLPVERPASGEARSGGGALDVPCARPQPGGCGALPRRGATAPRRQPGGWALRRDSTLEVVRSALRQRRGDPAGPIDPAQIRRLLAVVRAQLAGGRDGM